MNTARVSIRDQHLEIEAEIDSSALLALAPRGGNLDIPAKVAHARQTLENETRLEVNDAHRPLELRTFPAPEDIRAAEEKRNGDSHPHGQLMTVRWEVVEPLVDPQKVAITFPKDIGPVLITFVQPTTRWTQPGSTAAFSVLALPRQTTPEGSSRVGLGTIALVLALLALVGNVLVVRKRQT